MQKILLTGALIFAAVLLTTAQVSFAYSTVEGGCLTCHTNFANGAGTGHSEHASASVACSSCHGATPGSTPISPSKCVVCHPQGNPGQCNLVNFASHPNATCLGCHTSCAPTTTTTAAVTTTTTTAESTTTTTISDNSTTTTTTVETTTTTIPDNSTACLILAPNSVNVGADNVTVDVNVSFTRTDIINLPPSDLAKLVVAVDTSCAQYITINSVTIVDNSTSQVVAVVNITVKGNAPSSQCSISVTDPQNVATPPVDCQATFTINQTGGGECSVVSVEPAFELCPLKAGLIPRFRRIIITGENSNWNRTSAISIQNIRTIIQVRVAPTEIHAIMLIPSTLLGFEPGDKAVTVTTGAEVCQGMVTISSMF